MVTYLEDTTPPPKATSSPPSPPSTSAPARGDGLLDADAAASYLAVPKRYLYRLTSERRISFVKLGSKLRFRRRDLEAFIEANRMTAVKVG